MYDVTGKTAGILVRISDDREGRGLGVQRQESDTRALADRLGVKITKVYVENDISGSAIADDDRREFENFMADWDAGKFDVPLAYTTGRLTRDNIVAERIIVIAKSRAISPYYVASPWYDLSTAAGRRGYRGQAVNDTGEAEDIQERVKRKKLADAIEGKYNGGPRTYAIGEIIGKDPRSGQELRDWTKLDIAEAAVVRNIADRLLAGGSQMSIVRYMNDHCIRTARDGMAIKRNGVVTTCKGLWTVGKLKRTVLNPSYVIFDPADPEKRGTRLHHDAKYRAVWPGIFTQVEHQMLLTYFKLNANSWQQGKIIARRYLLSGFIHCGNCGGLMYGQGKTEKGKYIRRYHCKPYNNRGERVGCGKIFRIAEPIEHLVSEAVLFRFDSPAVHEALAPAEDKERVRALNQEIVQLQTRKQQLAAEHALKPYEDYGVMLTAIKQKMDVAQSELNRLKTEEARRAFVPMDGKLRETWKTASLEWRASVIKLLVKKVIVHPGRPGAQMYEGRRFNPELIEIEYAH